MINGIQRTARAAERLRVAIEETAAAVRVFLASMPKRLNAHERRMARRGGRR